MARLLISEIFLSLQGETRTVGIPTVFVRLTGCPLRCSYCDTPYAFKDGIWMDTQDILSRVTKFKIQHVTVTGGEPLAQTQCLELLSALCNNDHIVSIETSGALDISTVDCRVSRVVDLKTPGSGESKRNRYANIDVLTPQDQIKFVLCDRSDYEWAKSQLQAYNLPVRCEILLSPVLDLLAPHELAEWILADRLPVRFQLQLHKLLWGNKPGH